MSVSTDFLYIVLRGDGETKTSDCTCASTLAAGRLPSHDDLIQSDQYTQDVGGSCVNLTVPNRTLREYNYQGLVRTSDPDVANYTLSSVTNPDTFDRTFFLKSHGKIKRKPIDLDNPILWQDVSDQANISLYQAVTVATGHVLYYKSEFKADGYSLGDLLYSVPLAPGQKKEIVIIDSSHTLVGAETQNISQADSIAASLVNDREVLDQIAGNIGEAVQGSSSASTSGVSAGLGASGSVGAFGASLGVAGGYSNSNSSAEQSGSRNLSQFFHEKLRQSINQSAQGFRNMNATVVTTVQEGQKYNVETEVIANHNHCHSLTMLYFQVLRHFAVYQELVDVEECVFVPLLMTRFTIDNIRKWADVLAIYLLPIHSNTYLKQYNYVTRGNQHPLLPAFDAIDRIKTNYQLVDYPKSSYDEDPIREITGEFRIQTELPRPKSRYDFILSLPIINKTVTTEVTDAGDWVKTGVIAVLAPWTLLDGPQTHTETETIQVRKEIFDNFMSLDANYQNVPPAQCIRIHTFTSFKISSGAIVNPVLGIDMSPDDRRMWEAYSGLLELNVVDMLDLYFRDQLLSDWDTIFRSQIAPKVFSKMAKSLSIDAFSIDPTPVSKYYGGERTMQVAFHTEAPGKSRASIEYLKISSKSPLVQSIGTISVTFNLFSMRISYSTDHYSGLLFNGAVNDDVLDPAGANVWTPRSAEEKRNPRTEDRLLVDRLIDHLNCHLEYYNRILWYNLDSNRRWLLLDGFHIQVYQKNGLPDGFRSLASVLKNALIGVAGNSLVFPVAPGYSVSQSLIIRTEEGEEVSPSPLDYYRPTEPAPPYRLSVPTRGAFMEAVKGSCDACESLKPDSSQDWTQFTTDTPTAITAVSPPVPTVTNWQPQFQSLQPPIVSIQNAPALPDVGSGLLSLFHAYRLRSCCVY